jgi:hypothetical protein
MQKRKKNEVVFEVSLTNKKARSVYRKPFFNCTYQILTGRFEFRLYQSPIINSALTQRLLRGSRRCFGLRRQ